jgi:hypothetical protein
MSQSWYHLEEPENLRTRQSGTADTIALVGRTILLNGFKKKITVLRRIFF